MRLLVKKIYPDAILPVRAHPTDSGADVFLYSTDHLVLAAGERALINTGIVIAVGINPILKLILRLFGVGFEIQIRPRSGNALKRGLTLLNSPATIDESYRGELGIILINHSNSAQVFYPGDKIAQIVICPVILAKIQEVGELNTTQRGEGGFGHTDLRK